MKNFINKLLNDGGGIPQQQEKSEEDVIIATCALLLEIADADGHFSAEEKGKIAEILQQQYGLSPAAAREITRAAESQKEQSMDLWHFTNEINQQYSAEEKQQVIEQIWRVIYIDGHLDKHEDYLVHKMGRLLN
ncbi:MAG: TerB family tellurite resistance protein, partial [Calditrichia bacterium]